MKTFVKLCLYSKRHGTAQILTRKFKNPNFTYEKYVMKSSWNFAYLQATKCRTPFNLTRFSVFAIFRHFRRSSFERLRQIRQTQQLCYFWDSFSFLVELSWLFYLVDFIDVARVQFLIRKQRTEWIKAPPIKCVYSKVTWKWNEQKV